MLQDRRVDLIRTGTIALVQLDPLGRVEFANSHFQNLIGVSRSELNGKNWFDTCVRNGDRDQMREFVFEAASGQAQNAFCSCAVICQGDTFEVLEWNREVIGDEKTGAASVLLIGAVTGVRNDNPGALEPEPLLERLAAFVPGAIIQYQLNSDHTGQFNYASPGIQDIYELTPEQVRESSGPVFERIHPDDRQRVYDSVIESAEKLTPWRIEYRVNLPEKGERWLLGNTKPEKVSNGAVISHGYISDITDLKNSQSELERHQDYLEQLVEERTRELKQEIEERKTVQDSLRRSEARAQLIFNAAAGSIITIDKAGIITSINKTAERMFGYSEAEMVGQNVKMLMEDDVASRHDGYLRDYDESRKSAFLGKVREMVARRKSGEVFPVEIAANVLRDEDDIFFSAIVRDVSERKAYEDKLTAALEEIRESKEQIAQSESQLHLILETSSAGVTILRYDPIRRIYANPRFLEMFGASSIEELNAIDYRFTFVEEKDFVNASTALSKEDGVDHNIMQRRRLDGTLWWSLVDALAIDYYGEPAVIVWYFDISHQKAAEQELVQSEKMASLGGLVAGVAHEVNTPVGVCVTAATLLEQRAHEVAGLLDRAALSKDSLEDFLQTAKQSTSLISSNLQRASELISSFKQVSVDQTNEGLRTFDLTDYIEGIVKSLLPEIKKRTHAISVQGDKGIEFSSYPGALSQVLTNLIMNSFIHAYDEGQVGDIRICVEDLGTDARITYSDDGKGASEDVLNKIFEPFFTTNRGSGGSGLGMNIVYNLVTQKLRGTIEVQSTLQQGMRFAIKLPRNMN